MSASFPDSPVIALRFARPRWRAAEWRFSYRFENKDPAMFHYTALVTCLAILFYFFTAIQVSRARVAFGIKPPTISGNPDFERVFRVQMNTLEWMPIFLPSLWLFAIYISDAIAAGIGLVWVAGRILYLIGYAQAAVKRGPGFGIQASAAIILWVGALGAIVWRLVHPGAAAPQAISLMSRR